MGFIIKKCGKAKKELSYFMLISNSKLSLLCFFTIAVIILFLFIVFINFSFLIKYFVS